MGHTKAKDLLNHLKIFDRLFGVLSHCFVHKSKAGNVPITPENYLNSVMLCNSLSAAIDTASEYIQDLPLSAFIYSNKGPHICSVKSQGLKQESHDVTHVLGWILILLLRNHPKMFLKHGPFPLIYHIS